jgi:hypothetical protein
MAMMITIVIIAITIIIVIYNLLSWLMIWGAQNDQQFCDVMSIVGAFFCAMVLISDPYEGHLNSIQDPCRTEIRLSKSMLPEGKQTFRSPGAEFSLANPFYLDNLHPK